MPTIAEQDHPCTRLLQLEATTLSHAELVALLLDQNNHPRLLALNRAQALCQHVSTLKNLVTYSHQQLNQTLPITMEEYCRLQAGFELGRRLQLEPLSLGYCITTTNHVCQHLRHTIGNLEHEAFYVLLLDQTYRLIHQRALFHGTIHHTEVHPREVVKYALRHNAAAMIIAHNHPSDNTKPSPSDRELTITLKRTLALVDIRLLDHIIVGPKHCTSMATLGNLLD